jgi:hypothetical protein
MQAAATVTEAARHPRASTITASSGRNTSCPVAQAAPRMPRTSPRRATNQRFATIAPKTSATEPRRRADDQPHSTDSCQGAFITVVSRQPAAMSSSAPTAVRRTPTRSSSAAANGAATPYTSRLSDTAIDVSVRVQPRSVSMGTSSTPRLDRNAAEASSTRKVTAATSQARCGLGRPGRPGPATAAPAATGVPMSVIPPPATDARLARSYVLLRGCTHYPTLAACPQHRPAEPPQCHHAARG